MTRAFLLAALLALTHPPTLADATVAAESIEPVALDAPLWPVPSEVAPDSPEVAATGLLLAAIGFHESRFDERVRRCLTPGEGGAVSAYQLLGPSALNGWVKSEVCASDDIAVRAALGVVARHARRSARLTPAQWVAGYASGDPGKGSRAAREIVQIWAGMCQRAGLVLDPYNHVRPAWQTTR